MPTPLRLAAAVAPSLALILTAGTAVAQQANPHVGHVATGFAQTPGGKGLTVTTSTEAGVAMLHANLAARDPSDLEAMKLHAGHVLHALEPAEGSRGPGLGFGIKRAAEGVATHAGLAGSAAGASQSVTTHAEHIGSIARTVARRAEEAAAVARRIRAAATASEAAPLVEQLRALTYQVAEGKDLNGDDRLALDGEAGVQQLEAHVYLLLDGEGLPPVLR
jgi:hypothetical protein